MGYYNRADERARRERDTPAKIVQIARSKGYFDVSHRWRDDWLRARVGELVKLGFLKRGGGRVSGGHRYVPSDKWEKKICDARETTAAPNASQANGSAPNT